MTTILEWVAAGLAGAWAAIVAYYVWAYAAFLDEPPASALRFGGFALCFTAIQLGVIRALLALLGVLPW